MGTNEWILTPDSLPLHHKLSSCRWRIQKDPAEVGAERKCIFHSLAHSILPFLLRFVTVVLWAGSISSCPLSPGAGGAYMEGPSTCTVRRQNEQSTGGGTARQSSWTDGAGQTKNLPSFFVSFPKFLKSLRTKMKHPTKHSSLKGSPDQLVIFTWKEINFILNSLVRRKIQFCCRETFQRSFDLYVETYIHILNFELIFFKIYSKENNLIYTYVSRFTTHFSAHAYEMAWWQLTRP